jgi:uncharacterized protein (UPF0264 family)
MPLPLAADFVAFARRHRLLVGLAGSLRRARIPALLETGADYLGFRGPCAAASAPTGYPPARSARSAV